MEVVLFIALIALAVVGGVVAVLYASRAVPETGRPRQTVEHDGVVRVRAEVHTGWEQTLLGLTRELGLPRRSDDVPYGGFYLDPQSEERVLVRSRSEIGRGYIGALQLTPQRGLTVVDYSIVRLPGDETLHDRVLGLELQVISALRRIDRDVDVQLSGAALREFDRPRSGTDGMRPGAPERGA